MIRVENVHKTLAGQKVLDGVDFTIEKGTMTALLGISGTGKTVLLKNMIGLMRPDDGCVLIDGRDIHAVRGRELAEVRNSLGVLFQGGALFDSMSVYDNLAFPLREKTELTEEEIGVRIGEHLEMVEMIGSETKHPAQLSGGMRKRVALARALILHPGNVFFDEPTTGLDPMIANSILRLIYHLQAKLKFTAVMVTHQVRKVLQIVQRVAMLHKGKMIINEEPNAFMHSSNEIVAQYIRETLDGPLEARKHGS